MLKKEGLFRCYKETVPMALSTKVSLNLLRLLLLGLQLQEGFWARQETTPFLWTAILLKWGASLLLADLTDLFVSGSAPSGNPLQVNGSQPRVYPLSPLLPAGILTFF